jgi:hypothetical protein
VDTPDDTFVPNPADLGRIVEFDERSRDYPIRAVLEAEKFTKPRSYTWKVPVRLNQRREGACVGFAWAHEAAARPVVIGGLSDALARDMYKRAQQLDQWPGEAYSGTSVIAGAKVMKERGWLAEYRWAFTLEDALTAVSRTGPAVLGIPWYESMYYPNADGFIKPVGGMAVGGHAILCNGVSVRGKFATLTNSWGAAWGNNGACKISWDDLGRLLDESGEVCIPVERTKGL